MSAVSLEGAPVCFNWSITIGSLAAVVVLMIAGIFVAGNDIFATSKREQILSEILGNKFMTDREAMWAMTRVICFHKLHFLFAGSFLAASGAIVMHYTGMMAQRGPFRTEWDAGYVAASIASGIVICFVGFWIIFRLRWKIQQFWLRYVSAAVISAAFCFLHFFGMLGVTYHADNNKLDSCKSTWEMDETSPSAWTTHQRIIIALAIIVPSISLYIENLISQELILAYDVQEKENPNNLRNELFADGKSKLQTFLKDTAMPEDEDGDEEDLFNEQGQLLRAEKERRKPGNSKPIADLFTSTTIMVANLTGFTSWSSMREPSQVFMLLEAVYETFDKILRRFESVAKAEVTGDSYVAVAGLLDNARNKDHAIIMCRVAREMQQKITILTQKLEVVLGPDTGDVGVRIGLHR